MISRCLPRFSRPLGSRSVAAYAPSALRLSRGPTRLGVARRLGRQVLELGRRQLLQPKRRRGRNPLEKPQPSALALAGLRDRRRRVRASRPESIALPPPFFASHPAHAELPESFVNEFHDIGAQVGQSLLPGRGLAVTRRGGRENPAAFAMSTATRLRP